MHQSRVVACEPCEARRLLAASDLLPVLGLGVEQPPLQLSEQALNFVAGEQRTHALPDGRLMRATLGGRLLAFRFLPDGRSDPTFADGGTFFLDQDAQIYDLAVASDGRSFFAATIGDRAAVIALTADGVLDASFGDGGIATFDFAGETTRAVAIARLPSGALFLAADDALRTGLSGVPSLTSILKINADGTTDSSFGQNGRSVVAALSNKAGQVKRLVIQPDGKVVAAGSVGLSFQPGAGGYRGGFLAFRLLPTGAIDASFGKAGFYAAMRDGEFQEEFQDVALDSQGNLFLAGVVKEGGAIVKLNSRGVLDKSFSNTRGAKVVPVAVFYESALNSVQIDRSGRVLAAGSGTVARYARDGTPDESFAPGGVRQFGALDSGARPASAVELPDGRIVLMGDGFSGLSSYSTAGPMRVMRGDFTPPEETSLLPNGLLRLHLGQGPGSLLTRIVNGRYRVIRNGVTVNYALADIKSVYVIGSEAADRIELTVNGPFATIEARRGDDTIIATNGRDSISAGDGDDSIQSLGGADTVRSGAGVDTLDYSAATTGVVVRGLAIDRLNVPESVRENDRLHDDFERVIGSTGNDEIRLGVNGRWADGSAGDDSIRGSDGNDTIFGGSGFDTVEGGEGSNYIDGGSGNDTLTSNGLDADAAPLHNSTLYGQAGDDHLSLYSSGLADGGSGNDTVRGGPFYYYYSGNDDVDTSTTLLGQAGDDRIIVGRRRSIASGGGGSNTVSFEGRRENLRISPDGIANDGAAGDQINIGKDFDHFAGGSGDDVIYGNDRNNKINSNGGNDTIYGYAGDDDISGGALVYAGDGNDSVDFATKVYGGAGDDLLTGDTVYGGTGNDHLTGTTVFGEAGDDQINVFQPFYYFFAALPPALLDGGEGNDSLTGGGGPGTALGGAGDDSISAGFNDLVVVPPLPVRGWRYDGGAGNDVMSYQFRSRSVFITIDGIANDGNRNELDNVMPGFETLIGGNGFDQITGTGRSEAIFGKAGGDVIRGGGGNDFIDGGGGNDRLYGDGGDDTLLGGNGDDRLFGGNGNDSLAGNDGDDLLDGLLEVDVSPQQ